MSELNIKVEKLGPMHMLSAYGYGIEPESIAWGKLKDYCLDKGLYQEGDFPTTYGFNNPNPSENLDEYGYEIWLPVDGNVKPEGDLRIVDFCGGLYAVTSFEGLQNIGETWSKLAVWQKGSRYHKGSHQWLEELTSGPDLPPEQFTFNIYLPIVE